MITVKYLSRVSISALTLGLMIVGESAKAQTYTFTSYSTFTQGNVNGVAATAAAPIRVNFGQNVTLTGAGDPTNGFTYSPDFTLAPLQGVPFDNIVPFRLNTVQGSSTTADTFNDLFSLSLVVTASTGGTPGTFTFNNLGFNGFVDNNTDTVSITGIPTGAQTQIIGGQVFTVQLNSFTNPGNAAGANPFGSIGGRVSNQTLTATPEPGTLALLFGMGAAGLSVFSRRRRR